MSIQAIPVAAAGSESPTSALAASERVQRLQALIAQVERGPAGFAAALQAAQAGSTGQSTGASVNPSAEATGSAVPADYPATGQGAVYPASLQSSYPVATTAPGSATQIPASATATGEATQIPAATGSNGTVDAYAPLIDASAARNGLDPALLYGLIQQESGFDPNATSSAGALGLTQLMPGTATSLGVTEPLNPAQSIEGGARYLGQLMRQFGGNATDALAAYNAGPGAVQQYGGVPPYSETQQYVTKVLDNAAAYRQSAAGVTSASTTATPGAIA